MVHLTILTKTGNVSAPFDVSLATLGGDDFRDVEYINDSVHQPNASYFDELWPGVQEFHGDSAAGRRRCGQLLFRSRS